MKLVKFERQTLMTERTLSNSLMIKLECPGIKEFNPNAATDLWFNKYTRWKGSKDNKLDLESTTADLVAIEKESIEVSGEAEEDLHEIIEDEGDDVAPVYEFVQEPTDSDNESDYNIKDEDKVFAMIAPY